LLIKIRSKTENLYITILKTFNSVSDLKISGIYIAGIYLARDKEFL